jgi:aryl-alcohol dehydrogenase-like predicted oxidoreductase
MSLQVSTIGIGTYLGREDDETDALYLEAVLEAVALGCNVIDTALNYRGMKSERVVGRALRKLMEKDPAVREKLVIATKGGFIPCDADSGETQRELLKSRFLERGILKEEDIVEGCHSLKPEYIHECVLMSLENLGLEYIDIYYLHNPEIQLSKVSSDEFYYRLSTAFEVLEGFVRQGRIRMYGTATWDGYRLNTDDGCRISLKRALSAASATSAGPEHNFKIIQLPINIYMTEAVVKQNQEINGKRANVLGAAQDMGLYVMSSATLLQRRALQEKKLFTFRELDNLSNSASRRALQVIRSLPGVTTSLVGMKNVEHVRENLQLLKMPKLAPEEACRIIFTLSLTSG